MYEVHEEKFFGQKFFAPVEQLVKLIKDKMLTTPIFTHFEMHGIGGIFLLKRIPQHHQK